MGRGSVTGRSGSSGGGQSSLGYLFGSSDDHHNNNSNMQVPEIKPTVQNQVENNCDITQESLHTKSQNVVLINTPAGNLAANNPNNYHRADGQNTGNFITERPTTKIHSAPGGGSSLGYLFGGHDHNN